MEKFRKFQTIPYQYISLPNLIITNSIVGKFNFLIIFYLLDLFHHLNCSIVITKDLYLVHNAKLWLTKIFIS
jgi:hypothetical protein